MLSPSIQKNDTKAKWLIGIFSVVVFALISFLGKIKVEANLGFDVHVFAAINALLNATIAVFLILALYFVKQKKYVLHKKIMMAALVLSILFLVSYIAHHLFAGEARYGDINGDEIVSEVEKAAAGSNRIIYLLLLLTHIPLAGLVLPFILFTAYRGMTSEFDKHKKLAKIIWPLWLYVAITGPIIYLMIKPYYH